MGYFGVPQASPGGGGSATTVQEVSVAGPTAITGDLVLAHTASAVIGLTTPAAPAAGDVHVIYDADGRASASRITITGAGGQLIDGRATLVLDEDGLVARLTFDGTNWLLQLDRAHARDRLLEINEDFVTILGDGSRTPFEFSAGGGATIRPRLAETGHQGILRLLANNNNSGATVIAYSTEAGDDTGIAFDDGACFLDFWINVIQLATAGESFVLALGFGTDDIDISPDPGIYFVFNRGLSTTNWFAASRVAFTATETDTGVAVVAGTWTRLRIAIPADGLSAIFIIDGVVVTTLTTTLPTTARSIFVNLTKNAGNAAVSVDLDRIQYQKVLP